jgi:hypothetical protein
MESELIKLGNEDNSKVNGVATRSWLLRPLTVRERNDLTLAVNRYDAKALGRSS